MKRKKLISIIIRTKNEAKWISPCIRAILNQTYNNVEIIIVDNYSSDNTLELVNNFKLKNLKIHKIKKYTPGKAINLGIGKSKGEIIVLLSAHCIPVNNVWLINLVENLKYKNIAGVYGRQEPLTFSSDFDKRDLLNFFGLDKKIQTKDSFFHNANSCFYRKIWTKYKFDENVTNIEDRIWGDIVISENYKIIYEPKASVYHYHGINQDMDPVRAKNIVKILEGINIYNKNKISKRLIDGKKLKTICIIPIRGKNIKIDGEYLLKHTVDIAKKSKKIDHIFVATDSKETAKIAKELGVDASFLRPNYLSEDFVDESEILNYVISKFEKKSYKFDIVVCLKETYPFRSEKLIDSMIKVFSKQKFETLVAVRRELRTIWMDKGDSIELLPEGFMPRTLKENQALISLAGLCYITATTAIKNKSIFNENIATYEIDNFLESIEISNDKKLIKNYKLIKNFNKK